MTYAIRPVPPVQPVYKKTSHGFHLVLTILTLGFWSWVWPVVGFVNWHGNKQKREAYEQALADFTRAMQMYEEQQQYPPTIR